MKENIWLLSWLHYSHFIVVMHRMILPNCHCNLSVISPLCLHSLRPPPPPPPPPPPSTKYAGTCLINYSFDRRFHYIQTITRFRLHILHSLSTGGAETPPHGGTRAILGSFWTIAIILLSTFSGNLLTYLTITEHKLPFDTLEEAVQDENVVFYLPGNAVSKTVIEVRYKATTDLLRICLHSSWWRHQMETFSALLALCAGNSPVTGEFPTQRPVTRCFDVFFDLRLNERLIKQSWGWWFETPSRSLWRHCNDCRGSQSDESEVLWKVLKRRSVKHSTWLILGLHPANERCYKVTPYLIGWAQT